ncbi:hypothetical protein BGZ67_007445 [Mortierella alpina]|nr:hypothetical protein BGZ67_007445 [Mortierella alpina]
MAAKERAFQAARYASINISVPVEDNVVPDPLSSVSGAVALSSSPISSSYSGSSTTSDVQATIDIPQVNQTTNEKLEHSELQQKTEKQNNDHPRTIEEQINEHQQKIEEQNAQHQQKIEELNMEHKRLIEITNSGRHVF